MPSTLWTTSGTPLVSILPNRPIDVRHELAFNLRAAADPTTSYVEPTKHAYLGNADYVSLLFTSAFNSATSHEYYIEWSLDGLTWFRRQNIATAAGVNTMTDASQTKAVAAAAAWLHTFKVEAPYMRVWHKRTGGTAADTIALDVLLMTL